MQSRNSNLFVFDFPINYLDASRPAVLSAGGMEAGIRGIKLSLRCKHPEFRPPNPP